MMNRSVVDILADIEFIESCGSVVREAKILSQYKITAHRITPGIF